MKRTVIFLLAFLSLSLSFSQTINKEVVDDKGKPKLLGVVNKEGLTTTNYAKWFNENYSEYLVNDKVVNQLKDSIKGYTIKVFLGTWCGDSKRQVPRFYNILDAVKFPESQLEVIAVDKTEEAYKQSPTGEEKGLNIHRVPTFIFYKEGKEINRIVESPKETLERDILKIVTTNKYMPNYMAANYMHTLFQSNTIEALKLLESTLVPRLAEFVKGSRELNTLGYMYLRSDQTEKALYVFDLNTKIFPYKYNVYDSLGEAHFKSKNYAKALEHYNKVLELKPEDENALMMLSKIRKKL